MIHLSETLALQTVEDFLTSEEHARLRKVMDAELAATGWQPRSPAEVIPAPALAQEILQQATARALPTIRRALPSINSAAPWGYTELWADEQVVTHIDGIQDPAATHCRLGRIGVVLEDADVGGDFYIETTSSNMVWSGETTTAGDNFPPGTPLTRSRPHAPGPDTHQHDSAPEWLAEAHCTRWITDARAGTAVSYGAQVIHGVTPVRSGTLRKFVTDLLT